jgi:hypothetical protein
MIGCSIARSFRRFGLIFFLCTCAAPGFAADLASIPEPVTTAVVAPPPSEWSFRFTPYGWLVSLAERAR